MDFTIDRKQEKRMRVPSGDQVGEEGMQISSGKGRRSSRSRLHSSHRLIYQSLTILYRQQIGDV